MGVAFVMGLRDEGTFPQLVVGGRGLNTKKSKRKGKIDLEKPKCFKDVVIIHYTPRKIFCDMWGKENSVRVRVS